MMSTTEDISHSGGLSKKFFKYAFASIGAMWIFSIYTMVDGMFVGKGVGPTALAAVNLSMPFINTIFAIALSIAVGSSTLVTFYLGRNEPEKSNEIFTLNVIILTILSVTISFLSLLFLERLAIFLGATEETLVYVKDYLRMIIIFSTFFIVGYSLEVLVKADGFPAYSILFVTIGGLTNIVLDYLFVIVLSYGVQGAALATGLSQLVTCLGFLAHFLSGKSKLKFTKIKIDWSIVKRMFIIGFPDSLTELSAGITVFLFNFMILKHIGSNGVAAFGVIMYINNLVLMTMVGINQGMQPLVSFYNGKKDSGSIEKLIHLAFKVGIVFSIMFLLVCQFFTDQLVSLFISPDNVDVYHLSKQGLKIFSYSFILCGFNIILSGYFTALKQSKKATLISLLRGLVAISICIFLLPYIWGSTGIWLSPIGSEIITLGISVWIVLKSKTQSQETGRKNASLSYLTKY